MQELAPSSHRGQWDAVAAWPQKLGQLRGDARKRPRDGFGTGSPRSDPNPSPGGTEGWHGHARAGADLPRHGGNVERSFSRSRLPLPFRLLGSELCNAARSPRLLCVNPINISWSCFLQGKGCSQLRLSAAPTSREHLISFHQHPADPPCPPHSTLVNIPVPSRGSVSPNPSDSKALTKFHPWPLAPAQRSWGLQG